MIEWAKVADAPAAYSTMNTLFDRYLLDVTPTKALSTQDDDKRAVKELRVWFGHLAPHEVDAGLAYDFLEKRGRYVDRGGRRVFVHSTVRANREFAVLRHVMTYAVRWKVVRANPLYRLTKNPETPRTREVTAREVLAWYRVAGPMLGAYTALKLLTGLRKGDMLRLRKEWWDETGLFAEIGKTKKRILFERTPALAHAVERCLGRRAGGDRPGSARAAGSGGYLFCTRAGEAYTESGFDSIWQRRMGNLVAAGYARFTEHDLRSKAGDDAEAAGQAGHRLLGNSEAQFRRAYQRRTQRVQPVR